MESNSAKQRLRCLSSNFVVQRHNICDSLCGKYFNIFNKSARRITIIIWERFVIIGSWASFCDFQELKFMLCAQMTSHCNKSRIDWDIRRRRKNKKQKPRTSIDRSIDRFENVNQASKYAFMFGSLNVAKIPFFEPTKMLNWHFLHCMANCSFWKGFSRKIICKRKQMKIFRKFRSLTFDTFSDGMLCFFFI